MSNEIQIFTNEAFGNVRVVVDGDKTLFCGSDIAKSLGYARPADAVTAHCKGSAFYRPLPLAAFRTRNSFQRVMSTA